MQVNSIQEKLHRWRDIKNKAWTKQLLVEHAQICFTYKLNLPKPLIMIGDVQSYWGQYDHNKKLITINRSLIDTYSWAVVVEILKHEMAHQYAFIYHNDHTHGLHFQDACERLAVSPWARKGAGHIPEITDVEKPGERDQQEDGIFRKIEKLLRLAGSENEHEAMLAMQKVEALCRKHNIESWVDNRPVQCNYVVINHKKKRITQYQSLISHILQEHFMVDIVFGSQFDAATCQSHKTMEILGLSANVKIAEYVYFFLINRLPILWKQHLAKFKTGTRPSKNAYYLGVISGFEQHLRVSKINDQHKQPLVEGQKASKETKAMVETKKELENYVKKRYPRLRQRRWTSSYRDTASFESGKSDGQRLRLKPGIHDSNSNRSAKRKLLNPHGADR